RLRELRHDEQPLARRHGAEQALEPRHGLTRLTALEIEPRERAQRIARRRQRDDLAMPGDRALDLLRVLLGDLRVARPQARGARRLAARFEALRLLLEQIGELAVRALAREQLPDRVDRRVVTGAVFEVGAQRVEA